MNPNSQYQQQSPYGVSPVGTPQPPTSPSVEVRKQRRHYPRVQQEAYPPQPPSSQQSRTASPYQQQNSSYQQPSPYLQPSPYQQPVQSSPYLQPAQPSPYLQPAQTSPYLQPAQTSPYQQPAQAYQQPGSPYLQASPQQGYQQALNGMANMNINQAPRQDVPLVGQPTLIEDLQIEKGNPVIPPQFTATGSVNAQVDTCFNHATVNSFPYSNALLKKSKLPLALILQPYLSRKNEKTEVPVVADTVVTRCTRCKTYINPFVQFTAGALQWKCNMCGMENDVPQAFDWDITTQQQTDRYSRPELNYGCVDFVAPLEYTIRPPQPPVYVFVIDVSFQAVQTGMIGVVADAIKESLDSIPNEDGRTKVAFITVDNAVGFYKLVGNEPEILVVPDLNDIYLPRAASDLIVNLVESRPVVEDLLSKMKTMYANTHSPTNCLGSALKAARKLLSPTGGKIVCFQASVPKVGFGAITPKADTNKSVLDSPLMTPSHVFYKSFAADCVKVQVCADMFVFGGNNNQFADVCTLNVIPRFTGGQTHFYPGFNASIQPAECLRLKEEVKSLLEEQVGLEAVIRTRCSQGVVCHAFYGNCTTRIPDIMALPNVPRDQSYCIELVIEEEIQSSFVHFQTAMLYTTCFGERRIRVMNLCLPVTKSLSEVFASADQIAVARTICHQAIDKGATGKLREGRDHLSKQTVDIFTAYGKEVTGASTIAQLSICRPLALLPLLILAILKSEAFNDAQVPQDVRSQSAILLRILPTKSWLNYVYPRFYSIHNMPVLAGTVENGKMVLPPAAHLSSEKLEAHGCYMLENGQDIYLWIGKQAVPQLCKDLLGVSSIQEVKSTQLPMLPNVKSAISDRLIHVIKYLQSEREVTFYPTIYIIKEDGDALLRSRFLSHLVEDRQPTGPATAGANQQNVSSGMSYFQWLGYLRSKCQ